MSLSATDRFEKIGIRVDETARTTTEVFFKTVNGNLRGISSGTALPGGIQAATLAILQGIYASDDGFLDADGDALTIEVAGDPTIATIAGVEPAGYWNMLDADSLGRLQNARAIAHDLGKMVTRVTHTDGKVVHQLNSDLIVVPHIKPAPTHHGAIVAGRRYQLVVPADGSAPHFEETQQATRVIPTVIGGLHNDLSTITASLFTVVGVDGVVTFQPFATRFILLARPVVEGDFRGIASYSGFNSIRSYTKVADSDLVSIGDGNTVDLMIGGETVTCNVWVSQIARTATEAINVRVW